MEEKVMKKSPKIDKSNMGSSFELEPNKGKKKKKKNKERKEKHVTDKTVVSDDVLEENCTGEVAVEKQTRSIEGDITFMRNGREESNTNKRKKRKGGKDSEMVNSNIADDKKMQFLDDNQQKKPKKRKNCDDSLAGMQEMSASKPSKRGKAIEDNEFKSNEGDPPLVKIRTGDANVHSSVTTADCQGEKMEKKKLGNKSKKAVKDYKGNKGEHSIVTEDEGQGSKMMKMKKKLSKKSKITENKDYKSNEGDPCLAKSYESDPHLTKSNESDPHLAKSYEGEDDERGKKKKKKKKNKNKLSTKSERKENNEFESNKGDPPMAGVETGDAIVHCNVTELDDHDKKMKTNKKTKPRTRKSRKRVTFSDKVEICCDGFVRGKRFTPEEDEKIKQAVYNYIESHGLGDEGLEMVLHCGSYREVRHCWKEIAEALPERPYLSIYGRAHIVLERDMKSRWSREEMEFIRKVQEQHGCDWRMIAEAIGKSRSQVKDAWRRIKLANPKRGRWSQDEYQTLFDLVNLDLRVRAEEGFRKLKHGMLRDNISWEAISDKLGTRNSVSCCKKWYDQLTSPMISQGIWNDTDDYRLINALYSLDFCCMEEVDWDNLLEHRDGDVCRKRWNQMVVRIGEHGLKSFAEQVEILAKRYCPQLLEAREAFDSKPAFC